MGWNNFTQPRAVQDTYKPLDDNLVMHGAATLYDRAQQNANQISSQFSNLFGVNAYGKDAEVLGQLEGEAKQQIQELSKQGLDKPETISRINSLISQYQSHPDVNAIAQRSAFKTSEERKQKEAEDKGKTYNSRGLKQLYGYYSQGNYYRSPEGVSLNSGYQVPEFEKEFRETADKMKADGDVVYDPKSHSYIKTEGVNLNRLGNAYSNMVNSDPLKQRYYQDQAQDIYGDNLQQAFVQDKQEILAGFKEQYKAAMESGDYAKAQLAANNISGLDNYVKNASQSTMLNHFTKKLIQQDAATHANQYHWENTEIPKLSEAWKDANDFEQAKQLAKYNYDLKEQARIAKLSEINTKVKDEVLKAAYKRAMDLGYEIFNEDKSLVSEDVLNSYGLGKPVTTKPGEKEEVLLGEKSYKKSDVISNINSGNKNIIKNVIDSYIEPTTGNIEIDGDDIKYEHKGIGTPGWDRTIKKSDLLNKINGISSANSKTFIFKGSDGVMKTVPVTSEEESEFLKAHPDAKQQ